MSGYRKKSSQDSLKPPEITYESSIMGGFPTEPPPPPTHYLKKFKSKRLQWEWMKKNMPEGAEVCQVMKSTFGELSGVEVWLKKKGLVGDT